MYAWERDEAHGKYAYNDVTSWKGQQLNFLSMFIKENYPSFSSATPLKVLDIGCNAALNLKMFSSMFVNEENEYHGYDFNDTALSFARKNLPKGKFVKSNLHVENPFSLVEDNYFDFCFSTWVFTHIPTDGPGRETLIKEALRVSKNGIILDPDRRKRFPENYSDLNYPVTFISHHDLTDVVVIDDYTRYSKLVQEYLEENRVNSSIFYWKKS